MKKTFAVITKTPAIFGTQVIIFQNGEMVAKESLKGAEKLSERIALLLKNYSIEEACFVGPVSYTTQYMLNVQNILPNTKFYQFNTQGEIKKWQRT